MKKLNLNFPGIGSLLTKEQMKKVVGGYGSYCSKSCSENIDCGGTCKICSKATIYYLKCVTKVS